MKYFTAYRFLKYLSSNACLTRRLLRYHTYPNTTAVNEDSNFNFCPPSIFALASGSWSSIQNQGSGPMHQSPSDWVPELQNGSLDFPILKVLALLHWIPFDRRTQSRGQWEMTHWKVHCCEFGRIRENFVILSFNFSESHEIQNFQKAIRKKNLCMYKYLQQL